MKVINTNSAKTVKRAISFAPRGERAKWALLVVVGTQDISPLNWAIESGALKATSAKISDLLTIRADRDRYYYGIDEIFRRHHDILKKLRENAPALIPKLLGGVN